MTMKTYPIEFTAEELETLSVALNAAAVYFVTRSKTISAVYLKTSALWLRVVEAQKAAGLRKES